MRSVECSLVVLSDVRVVATAAKTQHWPYLTGRHCDSTN